jgi:nitroimidazol reductase NimA-like FMN-containing flavoprotein (pyridoxamine 5'-phosphate oxidase superfamily)
MFMPQFEKTERTRIRRMPKRASYDVAVVEAILAEGLYCHVGFSVDGQPYVIPTIYARIEDHLYLHGSAASRMLGAIGGRMPVCVTVTLLDGLVLARSGFHHSMNYRSVVVLGQATEVTDPDEKMAALKAIVDHVMVGRWEDVREPSTQELKATSVIRVPLEEVSAKIRTGPPVDDEEDYQLDCWAGEVPLRLVPEQPVADPQLRAGIALPAYAKNYKR